MRKLTSGMRADGFRFFYAMLNTSWEMVELLLRTTNLSVTTHEGETALHILVEYDDHQSGKSSLKSWPDVTIIPQTNEPIGSESCCHLH